MAGSIYDLANLQQMQAGLSPLVGLSQNDLAMAQQQAMRRQALEEEGRRLFAQQAFAQQQQARQLSGMRDNALAELGARADQRKTELSSRNEAIKGSVAELAALEGSLDKILTDDAKRRQVEAEKAAALEVIRNHPDELGKLSQLGISDFRTLASKVPDVKTRSSLLAEYESLARSLQSDPRYFIDPAVQAKQTAFQRRIQQLNEAIGRHVELGGSLPRMTPEEISVAPVKVDPFALPPVKGKPKASLDDIYGPPAPEEKKDFQGLVGMLTPIPSGTLSALGALTSAPFKQAYHNIKTLAVGGNFETTSDNLTPAQKAAIQSNIVDPIVLGNQQMWSYGRPATGLPSVARQAPTARPPATGFGALRESGGDVGSGYMILPNGKIVPQLPTNIGQIAAEHPYIPTLGDLGIIR